MNGNTTSKWIYERKKMNRCLFPQSRLGRWQQKKVNKYNKAFFSRKISNTKHKLKTFELGIKHKDPDITTLHVVIMETKNDLVEVQERLKCLLFSGCSLKDWVTLCS